MSLTVTTIFYLGDALSSFLAKDAPSLISGRIINISAATSRSPLAEGSKLFGKVIVYTRIMHEKR